MKKRMVLMTLHVLLNAALLYLAIMSMYIIHNQCKYMRPSTIISKYETGHDYKSHHYTDYYLTVKFLDREKETETFECGGVTFVEVNIGENWCFKRWKAEWEWYNSYGVFIMMILWCAWILSGILALCNRFDK